METIMHQDRSCKTALTKSEFDPQNPVSYYYIPELLTGSEAVTVDYGKSEFEQDKTTFRFGLVGLVVGVLLFGLLCLALPSISPAFANSPLVLFASVAVAWYVGEKMSHTLCVHYYRHQAN
ncbi:hypothetical protein [Enterococcus asini]|uniref:hypothetical protein n=1 Tax=Enterococcus asini TaxID=57732 RepID=UPI00266DD191|nr:hypothetical protein [Enterococcus asini]